MTREENIKKNLENIRSQIPQGVTLIVVTKTHPVSDLEILYELGVKDFGENRDQEGSLKASKLPSDVNWHFQGQIQSNKLKSILNWATYIHSLDDLDHAKKINRILSKPKEVFIQVSLDGKSHRGGVIPSLLSEFIDQIMELPMVKPIGLMAVAPIDINPNKAFQTLAEIKAEISEEFPEIRYLSAGMSGDFKEAISHGATHVRIGSSILGVRG